MRKIRKGDQVVIRAGRDLGKRGVVLRVLDDDTAIVEGVNMIKRHSRPNPYLGTPGGIIQKEAPMDISNIALFNPATSKPDRVGVKRLEDGRKVRFFKSNGEIIDS
ncbi:MAG: 50S ribosomal protein L24 [Gammaproteobacteria bacterium]|nr:50S ribosomal protein L24 [Gammaproteobacteria bacterium]